MRRRHFVGLESFEILVVMAALKLGDNVCGARIRQEIERCRGEEVNTGQFYSTMARLEQVQYLKTRKAEKVPGERGRPRRFATVIPGWKR
jgi:hypothetical protein